uniref:Acidic phospholipase A2 n=1 Tax=Azemiops feae TaxID=8773 RepID=A0A0D3N944_AZEFE|nr:acidic phospholipase A2 [Azemiops feae]
MRTLWIVAVLLMGVEGGILEFGRMIKEETEKIAFDTYTFYGCNCGWEGLRQPKDANDRCCFEHNCCYGKVTGCDPKTDPYPYSRENGAIICGGGTSCENQICECDKAAAICFRENLGTYNEEYMYYEYSNCPEASEQC